MPRPSRLALLLAALLLPAACGGGKDAAGSDQDARAALRAVKPIASATLDAELRITLDDAPAEVGRDVSLSLRGPFRANGPGRLPSLDWAVGFRGFGQAYQSRLRSTGNDVFVRLGGQDFAVGEDAVARLNDTSSGQADGLAALGVDPLGAVATVTATGAGTVAGTPTTRYGGTLSTSRLLDQVQRLMQRLPQARAGAGAGSLSARARAQVAQTFSPPRFQVDVAPDKTIRRISVSSRFRTRPSNRAAAQGITGGTIAYRAQYADVGRRVTVSPVRGARPLAEFVGEVQRLLRERAAG